jgi:hypothetical protein
MFQHWAFEVLGLAPDANERAIKRAYAAKLKTTRPDTDADGFQRLHEAYRQALRWIEIRDHIEWEHEEDDADDENRADRLQGIDESDTSDSALADTRDSLPVPEDGDPQDAGPLQTNPAHTDQSHADPFEPNASDVDALDLDRFFDDILRAAFEPRRQRLQHWLQEQPVLWSLQRKAMIGFRMLQLLDERKPPMPTCNFDVLVEFFGYHDLHSGHDPMLLRRLREELDRIWFQERKRWDTPGISMVVQPSAPVPWSAEASLARIRMEQERLAANDQQTWQRHQLDEWTRKAERIAAKDHAHLLSAPNRWRDLWLMVVPKYAAGLREFLLSIGLQPSGLASPGNDDTPPIAMRFDPKQVRFWLAAGDGRHWSWPRTAVALVRSLCWGLILMLWVLGTITLTAGADIHEGFGTLFDSLAIPPMLFTAWLIFAALKSLLYWQAGPEPHFTLWRWAHRGLVPVMAVASMIWSARSEAQAEPFYLALAAMLLAVIRDHGGRTQRRGAEAQLPPRLSRPVPLVLLASFAASIPILIEADDIAIGLLLGFWAAITTFWTRSWLSRRVR